MLHHVARKGWWTCVSKLRLVFWIRSAVVTNTMTECNFAQERIHSVYTSRSQSITEEGQGENSHRNLKQKPRRMPLAHLLSSSCSASLHIAQGHLPKDGSSHNGMVLFYQLEIKITTRGHVWEPTW